MITEDGKVGVNCVKNQPCNIFVFHAWLASTTSLYYFSKLSQGIWMSHDRNQNRCTILNKIWRLPTILELSIRKGQRKSRIVFIFVTPQRKGLLSFRFGRTVQFRLLLILWAQTLYARWLPQALFFRIPWLFLYNTKNSLTKLRLTSFQQIFFLH